MSNRNVICTLCGSKFKEVLPTEGDESEPTQGDGCAAYIWLRDEVWSLQAAYGSKYKGKIYSFIKNFPEKEFDPICDECVGKRLEDLKLIK
jgi:YHS domain-containing protein